MAEISAILQKLLIKPRNRKIFEMCKYNLNPIPFGILSFSQLRGGGGEGGGGRFGPHPRKYC